MNQAISLNQMTGLRVLGTRHGAKKIRKLVSESRQGDGSAVIDFASITLTQSFADELIGPLLLDMGRRCYRSSRSNLAPRMLARS